MRNNNDKIWKILRIVVPIVLVIIGAVYAYGALNRDVEHNTDKVKEHGIKIEKLNESVIEQRGDIKHIKETVDRIEKKL